MKLIVGLGNPGHEYENTRHNVGFKTIDKYASILGVSITKSKFNGLYVETMTQNEKIILLKPQSYINLSGEVIRKFVDFYKISVDDILIIHDDLDLAIGTFKLKKKGSSGGHNGLKNIELHLGTQMYKRIKIFDTKPTRKPSLKWKVANRRFGGRVLKPSPWGEGV